MELSVPVCRGSLKLRGKAWGNRNVHPSRRILAWPGWLDNCGSWYSSAAIYAQAGFFFVAMDPLGCGISSHRPKASFYNDFEETHHIMEVADFLQWKEPFILMGHSRGSNISSVVGSVFRERIRALVLIETGFAGFGSYISNSEYSGLNPKADGPMMGGFRSVVLEREKRISRKPKKFKSLSEATIHNNRHPTFPKSMETSYNIVSRHVRMIEGPNDRFFVPNDEMKLVFTHDTKTYGQGQVSMIFPSAQTAMKKGVKCPVFMMNVENNSMHVGTDYESFKRKMLKNPNFARFPEKVYRESYDNWIARTSAAKDLTFKTVPGKHHVHSDDAPLCVANVLQFLEDRLISIPDGFKGEISASSFPKLRDLRKLCFQGYSNLLKIADDEAKSSGNIQNFDVESNAFVFEACGVKISGSVFGDESAANRFICIHDDQDNAGIFDVFGRNVVSSLKDSCVVAFDRSGRGGTQKKADDQFYNPMEDSTLIYDVAKFCGWEDFHLITHCRGTALAFQFARAFPEMVSSISAISSFAATSEPLAYPNEFTASEIYYSFLEDKQQIEPQFPLEKFYRSEESQKLMYEYEKKFASQRDWRLDVRPPHFCAEEWAERMLTRVKCPVLLLNPVNKQTEAMEDFLKEKSSGNTLCRDYFRLNGRELKFLKASTNVELKKLPGSRYLHVDNCAETCNEVLRFLEKQKSSSKENGSNRIMKTMPTSSL